jgi:hypothetical protein
MAPQTLDQSLEGDPAAWTVAQVLVHGDPGFQWQRELLRENAHNRLVARGNRSLADADAGTGLDQRQLSQVAVRTHREGLAPPTSQCLAGMNSVTSSEPMSECLAKSAMLFGVPCRARYF